METKVIARRKAIAEQLEESPKEILQQVRHREETLKREPLRRKETILEQLFLAGTESATRLLQESAEAVLKQVECRGGTSESVRRRNLALSEMSKMGIEGFHGRDSLQFKATVYDQLAALGKSGVDQLMQEIMKEAGQTGQRLADLACEQVPTFWDHKIADIPRPLKESPEEIHEQVMAAAAAAERTGEPVYLTVRAEGKPPQSDHSTQALIDRFLEAKKNKLQPDSSTTYGAVLRPFARAYPQLPLEPEPIEKYLAPFSNENTTARHKFNVLRAFYNWLGHRGLIPTNPIKMVDKPAGQADEIVPLNAEQNQVLHDLPKTDREQGYVGLMLDHGFRLSEVIRLNVGDIHEDRIWVHGKERKEWFPLLGEVRGWLLKLADGRAADEPLFLGRQGRLSDSQVQLDIKRLLQRVGINGIRPSPHTLRHTFSTLAYLAGCDWDAVELLLRQKEKKRGVTNRYIHLSPEQRLKLVREKLERYSPLRLLVKTELGEKPDYAQG